jgi:ureidoglycolate hydrolase
LPLKGFVVQSISMIKNIRAENFKRYGWVIEYPQKKNAAAKENLFCIIMKETKLLGWRIAYLVVRDRAISRLEQHIGSYESFEPAGGSRALLFVAHTRSPQAIECFKLDKPVVLKKGVWHGVVTLGRETEIKITENARVTCRYWELGHLLPQRTR